jgi:hypothetical protein
VSVWTFILTNRGARNRDGVEGSACPIGVFTFLILSRYGARMRVISTIFCFFAAFVMIAPPFMACCVTGHVDVSVHSVPTSDASTLSCHTTVEVKSSHRDTQTPEKYCSSCDDCAVSIAFEVEANPLANTQSDPKVVTIANASSTQTRPELRLLRSTGPPASVPLRSHRTPLLRFDSQLI